MKRALVTIALAALSLSACQQPKTEPATEKSAASAAAAPEAKPGIELSEGRLVLPAVAGNPGAAYFQINNSAGASTVIAAISSRRAAGLIRTP